MVVSLVGAEGKQLMAFATSILEKDLADFIWGGSYFIKSLGLKQSASDKSYYYFEVVKKDV